MDSRLDMAVVASKYDHRVTVIQTDGSVCQKILSANPRRFYLRFAYLGAVAITYPLLPGPPLNPIPPAIAATLDWEVKYKDCPSICTGEWYIGAAAGGNILIVEDIFTE